MDMWVPLEKTTTNNINVKTSNVRQQTAVERIKFFFLVFIIFFSSKIHGNLTVGIHQNKHEKCYTRRGLRVGTKNKGFHLELR